MKTRNFFIVALAAMATLASAQTITQETKDRVLAAITKNVKERAYVGGADFSQWDKFVAEHEKDFAKAETNDAFAAAVNQALDEFGFSHIQLLTPRMSETRVSGTSVGIGVLIEPLPDGIRIVKVLPGGPAEKAGVKVNDIIIKADGVAVNSPERVRGPKGTKVVITVKRDDKELDIPIIRDTFSLIMKDELKWVDDKTALLHINSFSPPGYDAKLIDTLMDEALKAKRLIIDLRSNGGGQVMNLSHLAGRILPKDASLGKFITKSQADEFVKVHPNAQPEPTAVAKEFGLPLEGMARSDVKRFTGDVVVLVNGGSASASEIFAAAIRDNNRGRIVGTKSAGAVLASIFTRLPEGFSLQIPMMEYVTPRGKRLEGAGVSPDFLIDRNKISDDAAVLVVAAEAFESIKKDPKKQ